MEEDDRHATYQSLRAESEYRYSEIAVFDHREAGGKVVPTCKVDCCVPAGIADIRTRKTAATMLPAPFIAASVRPLHAPSNESEYFRLNLAFRFGFSDSNSPDKPNGLSRQGFGLVLVLCLLIAPAPSESRLPRRR